jgi:deoxyribodipyrimidine photolyase-related protein
VTQKKQLLHAGQKVAQLPARAKRQGPPLGEPGGVRICAAAQRGRGRRMAGVLRMILGDQLSPRLSALSDLNPANDIVLMAEVQDECTYVPHHAIKIVLVLSGMRHFASELAARGVAVDYIRLDDPANTHSLRGEFLRAVARHAPERAVMTEPGEWRLSEDMRHWQATSGIELDIRDDTRFFARIQDFLSWARGRRGLRMEFFYRDMRRQTGILMDGDSPAGGRWNFDAENRSSLPRQVQAPTTPCFPPDETTQAVMDLVLKRFPDHVGDAADFGLPVTREQARVALADFVRHRLPSFGTWQDAMKTGEPVLFHALVSTSLNLGLLEPREICEAAECAYRDGNAPLNAVEGFIRQILGWREYVRGIYWANMPDYAGKNALGATRRMPWFYWTGETRMNCLHQAIGDTLRHAYAHHIQRLMITGNFALLAGLHPDDVDEWYLVVYADAYQWVEMPNTRGMALFADGGIMGSKPYAASGAYINRMSDYCKSCAYDVKDAVGENACPFNFLYWDFFARNQKALAGNIRLAMPNKTLSRMDPVKVAAMRRNAAAFLASAAMDPEPSAARISRAPDPGTAGAA